MPPEDDDLPVYEVQLTEPAEAEMDAAYLNRMQNGLQSAERWYAGLVRALESLSTFPNRFPLASDNIASDGVRQMLYGSGSSAYRVLYRVIEPQKDEAGIVRVLHIRHASRRPLGEEDA
jgi:plasmid stabilization system protein ParE